MGIVICSIPLIIDRSTFPQFKVHDEKKKQNKREHNEM